MHRLRSSVLLALLAVMCAAVLPAGGASDTLEELLGRTSKQVSSFLNVISEVNCTERVMQEKLNEKGKVLEKEESAFDYLILLSNAGGELNLVESRLAAEENKHTKKPRAPLLVSNGFATLLLVFHPYYAAGFQFTLLGEETIGGRRLKKVQFRHVRGMRTPAALAVRGREYPLELEGTAWIDPESGVIARIAAGIDSGMDDVGLRALRSDVEYAQVSFRNPPQDSWLPAGATVEVESRHQHWRNTHRFTDYKRFSVSTKEEVGTK
jgi:hypothetical protein